MGLILFERVTNFLGRNGYFKCSGVEVIPYTHMKTVGGNRVCIQPITSRGVPGRCWMEIPVEELDALIGELQQAKAKMEVS